MNNFKIKKVFVSLLPFFLISALLLLQPVDEASAFLRGPSNEFMVGYDGFGNDPNEVYTITGDYYLYGDLYIMNSGELIISNSNFSISGNIFVIGNGKLTIKDSTISIMNLQDFHFFIRIVDNAKVSFNNSILATNGFSSHMYVRDTSTVDIANSILDTNKYSWLIAYIIDSSSLNVIDSEFPKEIIPSDRAIIDIDNATLLSTSIAVWLNFPYYVQADLSGLKSPFERSNVEIIPGSPGINGIDYTITTKDSNIYWIINPGFFSDIKISDSAVTMALFLYGYDGKDFVNLAPGYFSDFQLPLYEFERVIRLKNTHIFYWQLYLSGVGNQYAETFRIKNSGINELMVFTDCFTSVSNSIFGPAALGTQFTGQLSIKNSLINSVRIGSFNDSKIFFESCRIMGSPIFSTDNSNIYLKNISFEENIDNPLLPVRAKSSLTAYMASNIYLANISAPGNIYKLGDLIPVYGSALIKSGPDSTIKLKNYHFEYSLKDSGNWVNDGIIYTIPVYEDFLGNWDTSKVQAGKYYLKLVIVDSKNNTFYSFGEFELTP